mmetsp:Transcript_13343/g.29369  ORF Transcript_13343/g.29369 Transcript_13343/m.29369 type:complete len:447 (-) Transcript_13343:104-1444(-)
MSENQDKNNNNNNNNKTKNNGGKAQAETRELTVLGIYRRKVLSNEVDDMTFKDKPKYAVMSRERLKTRPLEEFQKNGQQAPKDSDDEDANFDKAWFLPETGLVMGQTSGGAESKNDEKDAEQTPKGPRPFFHEDVQEHGESKWNQRIFEERAILFQSMENYENLLSHPTLSKHLLDAKSKEEALQEIMEDPRFGEQIIVRGMDSSDICIGDIFAVEDGLSTLKLQVSSPRKPCKYVDKRNGSPYGGKGVKQYTLTNGLAGWFTRVLVEGELVQGMKLVRISQIADLLNPAAEEEERLWSLTELSKALYGEGPKRKQMLNYAHWKRDWDQLEQLAYSEVLGAYEWRDEAEWLVEEEGPDENVEVTLKPPALVAADDDDDITVTTAGSESTSDVQQSWGCDVFSTACTYPGSNPLSMWTTSIAACAITATLCAGTSMCMDLSEYTFCA